MIVVIILVALALAVLLSGDLRERLRNIGQDVTQNISGQENKTASTNTEKPDGEYNHPLLNAASEYNLRVGGVDLRTIPMQLSNAAEVCATKTLGLVRVNQVKSGATVTMDDYTKAKDCLTT